FGGVQVIFSGDFFQLPPIGNEEETSKQKFAFMSDAWLEAEPVICYLTEQYRQTHNELNFILNEIRNGTVSEDSVNLLQSRVEFHPDEGEMETKLFTHNADVDRINYTFLNQIGNSSKFFEAKIKGNPNLVEMLKKSVLALEKLELKIGAQVMFIRNNYESGFVNGTMGRVSGFTEKGFPLIRILNGELIEATPEVWAFEDEMGNTLASFTQIPLRLAWAITVHKSQGMTLDAAMIDLSKAFEKGQGYVALSRLRDLSGLKLRGLNQTALEVDDLAMRADKRFQELSQEWDDSLDEKTLEQEFKKFIVLCGGITDKKELIKQKEKLSQKGKAKKASTLEITKEYVLKKLSIKEIAEERGLTENTILGHLMKIAQSDSEIDLEIYRPKEEIIKKTKKILIKNPTARLGEIHERLNGEFTYNEIQRALIFIR
ncbi:MAG: helix-turn-helix domain-containing protein, partial [Weeksellaceae bacterium]|nr:helix-turn-helix domain-containing protein [Weeksellaceae bacterium]